MKAKELREMSEEQLGLTLKDLAKNLFNLRFQSATERLETPSEIMKVRRDIARIKTVQRERQRAKAKAAAAAAKVEAKPAAPPAKAAPAAPAKTAAPAKPAASAKPAKKEK